jgi:hypothetical protein
MDLQRVISETNWAKKVAEQAKNSENPDEVIDKHIGLLLGALKIESAENDMAKDIAQKIKQDL